MHKNYLRWPIEPVMMTINIATIEIDFILEAETKQITPATVIKTLRPIKLAPNSQLI